MTDGETSSSRARYGLLVLLTALLIYSLNANALWTTDHTSSLLHLDYAIWKDHTFALGKVGQYASKSVDDFAYNGSFYTALAPGTSILSLPFVVPGFILDGGFSPFGSANLLSEIFVGFMNSIAVLFLYKLGRVYFSEVTSAFLAFAYGFSTVSWPFATFFFQSDVSAPFALIAVYAALRLSRGEGGLGLAVIAGLATGAGMFVDYVSFLLVPVLLAYIVLSLWKIRRSRVVRTAGCFLLGASQGVIAIALYNLSSFGSILVTSEQLYLQSPTLFGNFSTPIYLGLLLNLVSPLRGIFISSPILILGALGYRKMLRKMKKEGLLFLSSFLVLFLPYCAWYGPEGGLSFGPRFIIASLPFLMLPAGYFLEDDKRRFNLAYILYSVGVMINGLAAMTSALASTTGWLASPFLDSTLPLLEQGTLDQWWKTSMDGYWFVGAGVILGLVLLLPLLFRDFVGMPTRRDGR